MIKISSKDNKLPTNSWYVLPPESKINIEKLIQYHVLINDVLYKYGNDEMLEAFHKERMWEKLSDK